VSPLLRRLPNRRRVPIEQTVSDRQNAIQAKERPSLTPASISAFFSPRGVTRPEGPSILRGFPFEQGSTLVTSTQKTAAEEALPRGPSHLKTNASSNLARSEWLQTVHG
jgi:hypothetical protein